MGAKPPKGVVLEGRDIGTVVFPDAELKGVFFPQAHSLAYWSFTSISAWPKWLGLFLGILFASLLA